MFTRFYQSAPAGGIILLICIVFSLLIANSAWAANFQDILDTEIGLRWTFFNVSCPVHVWINEGLMAIFFAVVGLEIRREFRKDYLYSFRQSSLPLLGAIGGALLPALIYFIFNGQSSGTAKGWAIPITTDFAFVFGVLSFLGRSVPTTVKMLFLKIAIGDYLIAFFVIAFFYSSELHLAPLGYSGLILMLLIFFNRIGAKNIFCYIIPGCVMWNFIRSSGIHAGVAGLVVAFTVPARVYDSYTSNKEMANILGRAVHFFILPLFALANTNISFRVSMVDGLLSNCGIGIVLGLLIGKPVGIYLSSWITVELKIAKLPSEISWLHILGLALLGGSGFTIAFFITQQSFENPVYQNAAKAAVLLASALAGVTGCVFMRIARKLDTGIS